MGSVGRISQEAAAEEDVTVEQPSRQGMHILRTGTREGRQCNGGWHPWPRDHSSEHTRDVLVRNTDPVLVPESKLISEIVLRTV